MVPSMSLQDIFSRKEIPKNKEDAAEREKNEEPKNGLETPSETQNNSRKKEIEKDFHKRLFFITAPSKSLPLTEHHAPHLYIQNKYEPSEVLEVTLDYLEEQLNDLKLQALSIEQELASIKVKTEKMKSGMKDILNMAK